MKQARPGHRHRVFIGGGLALHAHDLIHGKHIVIEMRHDP
jgi:hypothetical protein